MASRNTRNYIVKSFMSHISSTFTVFSRCARSELRKWLCWIRYTRVYHSVHLNTRNSFTTYSNKLSWRLSIIIFTFVRISLQKDSFLFSECIATISCGQEFRILKWEISFWKFQMQFIFQASETQHGIRNNGYHSCASNFNTSKSVVWSHFPLHFFLCSCNRFSSNDLRIMPK